MALIFLLVGNGISNQSNLVYSMYTFSLLSCVFGGRGGYLCRKGGWSANDKASHTSSSCVRPRNRMSEFMGVYPGEFDDIKSSGVNR